jgi:hypothetical protein
MKVTFLLHLWEVLLHLRLEILAELKTKQLVDYVRGYGGFLEILVRGRN